jgi:hypothetical protein
VRGTASGIAKPHRGGHVDARLSGASDLRGEMGVSAAEGATRAAAAQQAESSASHQHSERGRAGAPSAHGPNPPPSQHRDHGEGGKVAASAVKSRLGTPSRPVDGLRASTTITTTARATRTIEDAGDATTVTTIVTAAGRRTRGFRGPLAKHPGCDVPLAFPSSTNMPR